MKMIYSLSSMLPLADSIVTTGLWRIFSVMLLFQIFEQVSTMNIGIIIQSETKDSF